MASPENPAPETPAPGETAAQTSAAPNPTPDKKEAERQGAKSTLGSAMAALAFMYSKPKKKKRPMRKKRRARLMSTCDGLIQNRKMSTVGQNDEDFEYNWPVCACGMDHPPVPEFDPPDTKDRKCTYYWQIADAYPFMTMYRVLTTEIKFKEADVNHSGVIELEELKGLLKSVLADKITEKMVLKTFNTIDTDESGTIDFLEVLDMVNKVVQREHVELPTVMQKEYSKVCSIQ